MSESRHSASNTVHPGMLGSWLALASVVIGCGFSFFPVGIILAAAGVALGVLGLKARVADEILNWSAIVLSAIALVSCAAWATGILTL